MEKRRFERVNGKGVFRGRMALALSMAVVMLLTLLPTTALAANTEIRIAPDGFPYQDGGTGWSIVWGSEGNEVILEQGEFAFTDNALAGSYSGVPIVLQIGPKATLAAGTVGAYVNNLGGTISGGKYTYDVLNRDGSKITGGQFSDTVTNHEGAKITGGTFTGNVDNEGTISGGTFSDSNLLNKGIISDGTFTGAITNAAGAQITNGYFYGSITNNGSLSLKKFRIQVAGGGTATVVRNGKNAGNYLNPKTAYVIDTGSRPAGLYLLPYSPGTGDIPSSPYSIQSSFAAQPNGEDYSFTFPNIDTTLYVAFNNVTLDIQQLGMGDAKVLKNNVDTGGSLVSGEHYTVANMSGEYPAPPIGLYLLNKNDPLPTAPYVIQSAFTALLGGVGGYNFAAPDKDMTLYVVYSTRLDAPTDITWNMGTANWNAIKNASGYMLQLYKGGTTEAHALGSAVTVEDGASTSYDFSEVIAANGVDTYYFRIQAKGNGVNDTDSAWSVTSFAYVPLEFADSENLDIKEGWTGVPIDEFCVYDAVSGGVKPYTFCFEGNYPSWLQIADSGVGAGNIFGTRPDTIAAETVVKVKVTDSAWPKPSTATITIKVGEVKPWPSTYNPVTNIKDIPTSASAGVPLTLTGSPNLFATNKSITWEIVNAGTTGATLEGGILTAPAAGTVAMLARVVNGASPDEDYTQRFDVIVSGTLPSPANPVWSKDNEISWDTVDNAMEYYVRIYRNYGTYDRFGDDIQLSDTTANLSALIDQSGIYNFRVKAVGDGTTFFDSEWTEISAAVVYSRFQVEMRLTLDNAAYTGQTLALRDDTYGALYPLTEEGATGLYRNTAVHAGAYDILINGAFTGNKVVIGNYDRVGNAKISLDFVTVSFEPNGGTPAPEKQVILIDGYAEAPANMEKGTDIFGGWYVDSALTNEWTFDTDCVTEPTTLYAKWTPAPAFVPVTGLIYNGAYNMAAHASLTLSATVLPSKATNQTVVWSISDKDAGTTGAVIIGDVLRAAKAGTVTVTATVVNGAALDTDYEQEYSITVTPANYILTFKTGVNADEGQSERTQNKTEGVPLTLPGAIFTRAGFTQTGWSETDGGVKTYELDGEYTQDVAVSLYPFWTENAPVTYELTVTGGLGSGDYAEGALVQIVALISEPNQRFQSWSGADSLTFTAGDASSSNAAFAMPAEDVSLTAQYYELTTQTTLTLPKSLNEIGEEALRGGAFEEVVCPEGLYALGARAFSQCPNLMHVILPESVESIAEDAFLGCEDTVIICGKDSYAMRYAIAHGMEYQLYD